MSPRGEETWSVPLGLYLVLALAPAFAVGQAFGRIPTGFAIWLWGILGVTAIAATVFGRRHPVACVRPLSWRSRPWLFVGRTLVFWIFIQLGGGEFSPSYRAVGLGVAALFVFLATPADVPGARIGRSGSG